MATLTERLQFLLTANVDGAVRGFQRVGSAAEKDLGKAEQKLDKLGSNLTKFGAGALAFAGVAGAGLVKLAGGASDLSESVNAVNVTFGEASDGVLKLGDDAAKSVGLSKREFNGLAVQFSSFVKTIVGEGGDVVGKMDELTTRTADFASVLNLDVPEAARIFQSALAGETEPIKKFGIDLSAASVAAYAVANGISESAASMTEAEKVQARYGLLMESTSHMAGDFANTSTELANRQRILKAELQNLADGIGTGLLPMLTNVVSFAGGIAEKFSNLDPSTQALIGRFAGLAVAGIGVVGALSFITGQVVKMRQNLAPLIDRLRNAEGELTKAGKAATAMGVAAGAAFTAWSLNAAHAAKQQGDFNDAVSEVASLTNDEIWQNFPDFLANAHFAGKDAAEAFRELADADLAAARRMLEVAEAHGGYVEIAGTTIHVTDDLKNAISDAETAQRQQTEATQAGAEATEDNTTALSDAAKATQKFKDLVNEAREAVEKQTKAIKAQQEATRSAIDADFALRSATRDATTAISDYTAKAASAETTTEDLVLAQENAEKAALDQADAAVRLAEQQAKANGQTLTNKQTADIYRESLLGIAATLDPNSSLARNLVAYADRLGSIPGNVHTDVTVDTSLAEQAIAAFKAAVSGGQVTIPVRAEVSAGGGGASGGRKQRASGGPTWRGEAFEINERNHPEVLQEGGRTYLLPGGDGQVTPLAPMAQGGGGGTFNITINMPPGSDGDDVVRKIREYERRNGPGWRQG